MLLHIGCEMRFELSAPTPMIALLNVHHTQSDLLVQPDRLQVSPRVDVEYYHDGFGNLCSRFIAPQGQLVLRTDGLIRDDGKPDPVRRGARQLPVEQLPSEVLTYLLASRYCETDSLMGQAWALFSDGPQQGWDQVQRICDFVHNHIRFGYEHSRPTRTAAEAFAEQVGVCRDYTHLAITLCRCMNIPSRYCTGYISDIGVPPPYAPMDFCAWMEVYLDGEWHAFDPRNNAPRVGRILIARGRDAADVPLTHSFGPHILSGFKVWIYDDAAQPVPGNEPSPIWQAA
jgi:transglutaminase-like putative cysteine protease